MDKEMKKILVVDDEPDLCQMIKRSLERCKEYEVITTTNPQEVLTICESSKPDLILLDVLMPQVSGPELLQKLRHDPRTSHIPIIITSGDGEVRYNQHQEAWGMNAHESDIQNWKEQVGWNEKMQQSASSLGDDFLAKPFSLKTLLSVVRDILNRPQRYPSSSPEPQKDS
jgi:CheY-like chemotaxis protein